MQSIPVFQVYKSVLRIPKTEYTPEMRQWLKIHRKPFVSCNGYWENGILHLPNSLKSEHDLNATNLILIQDDFADTLAEPSINKPINKLPEWWLRQFREKPNVYFSPKQNHTFKYEVFVFNKGEGYSLTLNYSENANEIGAPNREDHSIAQLKEGDVLRYRINGINDFSMTGRRQRTYAEFDYLLHYVGRANSIVFGAPNQIEHLKTPPQATKEVDERKHFY